MNNLQLIEKVLYYIDEHIGEELTYERLAEVFGYYVRQQRTWQIFVIELDLIVFRLLTGCLGILLECSHLWQGKGLS